MGHKFLKLRIDQSGADAMAHVPSRTVRPEAHVEIWRVLTPFLLVKFLTTAKKFSL
jgi:hypothetical protein